MFLISLKADDRKFVSFSGDTVSDGEWKCSGHKSATCSHVRKAKASKLLDKFFHVEEPVEETDDQRGWEQDRGTFLFTFVIFNN